MMDLFARILVAVDDSESSRQAAVMAAELAREHGGELLMCHAVNWVPIVAQMASCGALTNLDAIADELKSRGAVVLDRCAQTAARAGSPAVCTLLEGEPAAAIVDLAERERCSVLIAGTHDHTLAERLFVGSVAQALLRTSGIPVLTARAGRPSPVEGRRTFEHIIVGIDGSEPSDAALETVLALPPEDRKIVFFSCVAGESAVEFEQAEAVIAKALALAAAHGVAANGLVVAGRADALLVAAAQQRDADLIVVGSHGRRGVARFVLGSVAENVVRTSPVPVLVVRTHARLAASPATSFAATASASPRSVR
jgi:nucleotide-binding universal stress UspA family protein